MALQHADAGYSRLRNVASSLVCNMALIYSPVATFLYTVSQNGTESVRLNGKVDGEAGVKT